MTPTFDNDPIDDYDSSQSTRPLSTEALGHLHEQTRAPCPAPEIVVQPGQICTIEIMPQRPMRGPYWIGFTNAQHLAIREIRFGMNMATNCQGEMPGGFFDVNHPELLIPIACVPLSLGCTFSATVRNISHLAIEVLTTLWGSLATDDAPDRPRLPRPFACRAIEPLAGFEFCELSTSSCPACHLPNCGFALAERYRRQSRLLQEELEERRPETIALRQRENTLLARREADHDATILHCNRAGYELGDSWETPTDES